MYHRKITLNMHINMNLSPQVKLSTRRFVHMLPAPKGVYPHACPARCSRKSLSLIGACVCTTYVHESEGEAHACSVYITRVRVRHVCT